jgi:hypothetical protein
MHAYFERLETEIHKSKKVFSYNRRVSIITATKVST